MTRENKLALVVGFGLVLFVGILVSDHLSAVHREQPADLNDRLTQRTARETGVIEVGPQRPPMAVNSAQANRRVGDSGSGGGTATDAPVTPGSAPVDLPRDPLLSNGSPVQRADGRRPEGTPPATTPVVPNNANNSNDAIVLGNGRVPVTAREHVHVVAPGETLSAIARRHYGSATVPVVERLAAHNGLRNPNALRVGAELRLPAAEAVGVGSGGVVNTADRRTVAPTIRFEEYTVKQGDTLSSIAERFLNSKGRWREIVEHNRDRIENPDRLIPGTRIRVPSSASGRSSTV